MQPAPCSTSYQHVTPNMAHPHLSWHCVCTHPQQQCQTPPTVIRHAWTRTCISSRATRKERQQEHRSHCYHRCTSSKSVHTMPIENDRRLRLTPGLATDCMAGMRRSPTCLVAPAQRGKGCARRIPPHAQAAISLC